MSTRVQGTQADMREGTNMNALNILVFGLIAVLAVVLLMFVNSSEMVRNLADHSIAFVFAIGLIGLVGAREKNA